MIMNLDNLKLISKKIFIEGIKVVTLSAGVKVLSTAIEHGIEGVKSLKIDELME